LLVPEQSSHVPVVVGEESPELLLLGHLNRHAPHHAVLARVRMPDREATGNVVRRTGSELEKGWDPRGSHPYFEQLLPGVAGFSLAGERVEDMFKLSQDKAEEVRGLVADALAGVDGGGG
jgi:predicted FMN-binding regulatory protein PaiB